MPTVAAIQAPATPEVERNLARLAELARLAADRGAQLLCLPQLCCTPWFPARGGPVPVADHRPLLEPLAALAAEEGVHLLAPLPERRGDAWFNTCFHLTPEGEAEAVHRKQVLPEVEGYRERSCFAPGPEPPRPFAAAGLSVGVQICWENYLPEGARLLALAGAELIFAPTAAAYDSHDRWRALLATHALCNNCYVLRLNRVGEEEALRFYGRSFLADPYGEVVAEAGEGEAILMAEVEPGRVAEARAATRFLEDRRPEDYGPLAAPAAGR